MMALLGGIHAFAGPMIGALIYWELQNQVSQLTKYWEAVVGAVFVVFVLVAPRGVYGLIADIRRFGFRRAEEAEIEELEEERREADEQSSEVWLE